MLSPAQGAVGSSIVVSGANWPAEQPVTLTIVKPQPGMTQIQIDPGATIGSVSTASDGTFESAIALPVDQGWEGQSEALVVAYTADLSKSSIARFEIVSGPSPTEQATESVKPTQEPTGKATQEPVVEPTQEVTAEPTQEPIVEPTEEATAEPTQEPEVQPTQEPAIEPTQEPTMEPTPSQRQEPTCRTYRRADSRANRGADGQRCAITADLVPGSCQRDSWDYSYSSW